MHQTRAIALGDVIRNCFAENDPEDLLTGIENGEDRIGLCRLLGGCRTQINRNAIGQKIFFLRDY